jgi:hypothetical protein
MNTAHPDMAIQSTSTDNRSIFVYFLLLIVTSSLKSPGHFYRWSGQ